MPRLDPIPDLKRAAGAALAQRIAHWTSVHDAAALLDTDRARIGDIRRGRLARFSLETLLRFLVRAGARIELRVMDPMPSHERAKLTDESHPIPAAPV